MEKEFVTYEIALKLEELGYDDPCFKVYDEKGFLQDEDVMDALKLIKVLAPLWQQAIEWLRTNKRIYISIRSWTDLGYSLFWYEIYRFDSSEIIKPNLPESDNGYRTFEEAREQAILKAIEIIKTGVQ